LASLPKLRSKQGSRKFGTRFRPYMILDAFNLPFAYKARLTENKIDALPRNLIVQQLKDGVEVVAVASGVSMQAVENKALERSSD
jgi:hypothetical protein